MMIYRQLTHNIIIEEVFSIALAELYSQRYQIVYPSTAANMRTAKNSEKPFSLSLSPTRLKRQYQVF